MQKVVLLRHGESTWNKENLYTGWTDVDLSEKGVTEAHDGGKLLREGGYVFDVAYTSVLKRAIRTLWIALDELDQFVCFSIPNCYSVFHFNPLLVPGPARNRRIPQSVDSLSSSRILQIRSTSPRSGYT